MLLQLSQLREKCSKKLIAKTFRRKKIKHMMLIKTQLSLDIYYNRKQKKISFLFKPLKLNKYLYD